LYSADIFDQRGVAYPEGTWTWADFAETAAKVYWESDPGFFPDPSIREDLANPLFGAKIQPDTLLPVLLAQLGSSGFAGEGQEMRRALDLLLSLKSNPVLFWYESTGPLALGRVAMEPAFVSQGVYFSNNYSVWAQRTVRDELTWGWRPYQNTAPPFDWGIAQLPSFSDGLDVTEALVQSVAIPASARDPLAAWDVVKFLIGRSGAEIFARSGALPANLVDQIPDVWLRTLADLGYKSPQGVGALPTLRYSVAGRQLGIVEFQFRWELSLMLQDLFAGRISLDEAVRRAGEMQRELALGR